jgi:hypothetical protein
VSRRIDGYAQDRKRVAVLGDEGLLSRAGAVEVAGGDGAVGGGRGREEVVREAVLLDQALRDDPEDLRPDLADGVDTEVTGLVERLVRRGVDGLVLQITVRVNGHEAAEGRTYKRVGVVPDALNAVGSPRAHGVVRVVRRAADGGGQEV